MKIHWRTAAKHFAPSTRALQTSVPRVRENSFFRCRFSRGDYEFAFRSASCAVFEKKGKEAARTDEINRIDSVAQWRKCILKCDSVNGRR